MRRLLFATYMLWTCHHRNTIFRRLKNDAVHMQYASNAITYFQSHMFAKLRGVLQESPFKTPFPCVLYSHELLLPTYALCFKTTNLWIRNIDSKLRCMLKQLVLVVQNRSEGCETASLVLSNAALSTCQLCSVERLMFQHLLGIQRSCAKIWRKNTRDNVFS